MLLMKRISILSMLLVFLLGNIGLSIYTHSCKLDGIETTFFVQSTDHCSDEHSDHKAPEKPTSCCDEEVDSEGCCTTDTEYVQLNVDLNNHDYQPSAFIVPTFIATLENYFSNELIVEKSFSSDYFIHPPPKYQGRSLQSIIQIFTI